MHIDSPFDHVLVQSTSLSSGKLLALQKVFPCTWQTLGFHALGPARTLRLSRRHTYNLCSHHVRSNTDIVSVKEMKVMGYNMFGSVECKTRNTWQFPGQIMLWFWQLSTSPRYLVGACSLRIQRSSLDDKPVRPQEGWRSARGLNHRIEWVSQSLEKKNRLVLTVLMMVLISYCYLTVVSIQKSRACNVSCPIAVVEASFSDASTFRQLASTSEAVLKTTCPSCGCRPFAISCP